MTNKLLSVTILIACLVFSGCANNTKLAQERYNRSAVQYQEALEHGSPYRIKDAQRLYDYNAGYLAGVKK